MERVDICPDCGCELEQTSILNIYSCEKCKKKIKIIVNGPSVDYKYANDLENEILSLESIFILEKNEYENLFEEKIIDFNSRLFLRFFVGLLFFVTALLTIFALISAILLIAEPYLDSYATLETYKVGALTLLFIISAFSSMFLYRKRIAILSNLKQEKLSIINEVSNHYIKMIEIREKHKEKRKALNRIYIKNYGV